LIRCLVRTLRGATFHHHSVLRPLVRVQGLAMSHRFLARSGKPSERLS